MLIINVLRSIRSRHAVNSGSGCVHTAAQLMGPIRKIQIISEIITFKIITFGLKPSVTTPFNFFYLFFLENQKFS